MNQLHDMDNKSDVINNTASHDVNKAEIVELLPWSTTGMDGDWIGRISLPLFLISGAFGNVMTITILRRLQWSSMNAYLTALALSDSGMLSTAGLGLWFRKTVHYDLFASNWVVCKLLVWGYNTAASLSCWFLVALTLQRALSVTWPHRVNLICTRKITNLVVIIITVVLFALYSHILYGLDLVYIGNNTEPRCTFSTLSYQDFWGEVWVMVDMFVYSVLPSLFLVIGNSVLAWKLAASVREARSKLATGGSDAMTTREKKASSATKTVLVVSVAFVIFTLPLMSYNIFFHYFTPENPEARELHYFVFECFSVLALGNFSINFYLYILTGTKFRNEFKKMMCGRRANASDVLGQAGVSRTTVSSTLRSETNYEAGDDF